MQSLFSDFPATNTERWREQVISELKGKPFDRLQWQWPEGVRLEPYYSLNDLAGYAYLREFDGKITTPDATTGAPRSWNNCPIIWHTDEEETANAEALEALTGGAEGVVFAINDGAALSIPKLLKNIQLPYCTVAFRVKENPAVLLKAYRKYAESENHAFDQLNGYLLYDPIGNLADQGYYDASGLEQITNVLEMADDMPYFRGLAIDLTRFAASGARPTQQIGAGLSLLAEYLDHLTESGHSPTLLFNELCITVSVGSSYFAEIAKLRVLRMLIHRIALGYDLKDFQMSDICLHAETSRWTKSMLDPHTNMLRATTEAMSAVLGGCNLLSVLPYDASYAESSRFSRRISRNLSTMLREEAHFDKTNDPVAGTWYIQALMHALYKEGWKFFLSLEEAGGFRTALEKGTLGEVIGHARSEQFEALDRREIRRVGINAYCNPQEQIPLGTIPAPAAANLSTLPYQRLGQQFERLRQKTDEFVQQTGERPRIALLLFGDAGMRRARAAFAAELVQCGGFLTEEVIIPTEEAQRPDLSSYPAFVLCSSDEEYGYQAPALVDQLKQQYAKPVYVAGNPNSLNDAVNNSAVDGFMHLKTPALALLTVLQEKLFAL